MKRILSTMVLMLVLAASMTGCASYLPCGIIFTEVKAPISVVSEDVSYTKTGTSMATSIIGFVATGDASLETAMKNGGITKVKHVEYSVKNILGVYGEYKTIVYGD